jgi:hypothetical protein
MGVDTAVTVPDETALKKSVLLLTPTTVPPSPWALSQVWADVLARLSMIEQYTPPCTMPHGCSRSSFRVSCARPPSGVSSRIFSPSTSSKPAVTEFVTVPCLHRRRAAKSGWAPYTMCTGPNLEWTGGLCSPQDSAAVRWFFDARRAFVPITIGKAALI